MSRKFLAIPASKIRKLNRMTRIRAKYGHLDYSQLRDAANDAGFYKDDESGEFVFGQELANSDKKTKKQAMRQIKGIEEAIELYLDDQEAKRIMKKLREQRNS
jgi:hypothetical protein